MTHQDYMQKIWQHAQILDGVKDPLRRAWLAVENDLMCQGKRRYKTYLSFRQGKNKKPRKARLKSVN